MKLTSMDKELLKNWGHEDEDCNQIERATTKTTYKSDNKKISLDEALKILGRETYLSGISRSAFHFSAYRQNEKGVAVLFDSSKLFRWLMIT